MRKHLSYITFVILAVAVSISSCKKDKEAEDGSYMTGYISFYIPNYLIASQDLELNATGITSPESGLTYKWIATGFTRDSLEGQNINVKVPSEHGSYKITVTVSHPDYTSTSSTREIIVIDPSNPNSFYGVVNGDTFITDSRDGKEYYYKRIGDLDWFTSNLKWEGAGKQYDSIRALNEIYGTLYTWNQATGGVSSQGLGNGPQGVCPEGWTIPTREDWENFATAISGTPLSFYNEWAGIGEKAAVQAYLNGNAIWKYSPDNTKANSTGWNALPSGNSSNLFKSFANLGTFGFWWSATQKDEQNGEYRFIHFDNSKFPYSHAGKGFFAASVRCVRKPE